MFGMTIAPVELRVLIKRLIPSQVFPSSLPRPGCATYKGFRKAWEGSEGAGYLAGAGGTCDGYLHAWGRGGPVQGMRVLWLVGWAGCGFPSPSDGSFGGASSRDHHDIVIINLKGSTLISLTTVHARRTTE